MAADVYGVLVNLEVPYGWDYAITSDGRVFFINDYDKVTTWMNPVTGEPVQSGHSTALGLPRGWEMGYTPETIKYYINHMDKLTTFTNPVTGKAEAKKTMGLDGELQEEGVKSKLPFKARLGTGYHPLSHSANLEVAVDSPGSRLEIKVKSGYHDAHCHNSMCGAHPSYPSSLGLLDRILICADAVNFEELADLTPKNGKEPAGPTSPEPHSHQQVVLSNTGPNANHNHGELSSPDKAFNVATGDDYRGINTNQVVTTSNTGQRQHGRQGQHHQQQTEGSGDPYHHHHQAAPYKPSGLDTQANPQFLTNSPITSKSKSIIGRITPKRNSGIKRQTPTKKMDGPQVRSRQLDAPVSMKGWLYKFESSAAGVRKWKHRYFVLQDFCLYAYKDAREIEILYSILLPSYKITLDTKYSKQFGFKAEHENMKTHYFAAEHLDSQNSWVAALRLASAMQRDVYAEQEFNRTEGDGTDSPMVSSPYHDHSTKDKYTPTPYPHHSHHSGRGSGRPVPHPIRSPLAPPQMADHHWARTGLAHPSGGWQVRREPNVWDGEEYVGRPHTPPIQPHNSEYNPGYNYDYQDNAYASDYERGDSIDYPIGSLYNPSVHHKLPHPSTYTPPRPRSAYARSNMLEESMSGPPYDHSAVRGHSVLMPPFNATGRDTAVDEVDVVRSRSMLGHNGYTSPSLQYHVHADDTVDADATYSYAYREHSVSIRGAPRTPPSVVSPPWKRENPQTPTYRPPHYENLPLAPPPLGTGSALTTAGQAGAPPRPHQLSTSSGGSEIKGNEQDHHVRRDESTVFSPQKWRDELQARRNTMKHLDDALIFQFPVPYRQPGWLEGHRPVHEPINYQQRMPVYMSRNNSNNNQPPPSEPVSSTNFTGNSVQRPSAKMNNRGNITASQLVGKSHEELVLLLIELRREQSQLKSAAVSATTRLNNIHTGMGSLEQSLKDGSSVAKEAASLKLRIKGMEEEIEIYRPLIQLVENMVKMGNTATGSSRPTRSRDTNASVQSSESERRSDEFNRHLGEKHLEREHLLAPTHPAILDQKMEQMYKLDLEIQKQSDLLNTLRHRMRNLEDDLVNINRLLGRNEHPVHRANQLLEDKHRAEFQLSQVRKEMAKQSQKMEQLNNRNTNLQKEVVLIKTQLSAASEQDNHTHSYSSTDRHLQSSAQDTQLAIDGLHIKGRALEKAVSNLKSQNHMDERSQSSSHSEMDLDGADVPQQSSVSRIPPPTANSNTQSNIPGSGMGRSKPTTIRDMKRASASRHEQQQQSYRGDTSQGHLHQASPVYFHSPTLPSSYSPINKQLSNQHRHPQKQRPRSAYEPRECSSNQSFELLDASTPVLPPHTTDTSMVGGADDVRAPTPPWAVKPKVVRPVPLRGKAQSRRRENKARFMTISSSQPAELEALNIHNAALNTFYATKGSLARSFTTLDKPFTHDLIDHQFLTPQKVHIPERYVPDSSDEEEEILSPEERQKRAEKAEQIRKMVASQSLQEFSRSEINARDERVAERVSEEKRRRETVLEMRHAMAKEVTQKSKESREVHKLRSKSQENLSWPVESC